MERALVLLIGGGRPQAFLADLLEARGFHTLCSESAEDGIRIAREVRPDVVLTELFVPDERGLCVAELLKGDAETAGIHVVVWTSRAFPEHRERATRAAADAFVPMPATIDELVATVERLAAVP